MSDDLNTEIKIGADASGVEAGVGRAKRSLSDLGVAAKKAGKDAGDGVGSIGAGGDKAARDVERATKSMQGSLQRLLAEQKAGAKGSREYYEALADTRGISRNAIKPILDQIDAAKSKTLQAKTAADSWTASLGKVGPLVAAAFSGAAITGFLGKVVAVQREFDVLNSSLKTVTGSSAAAEREMAWLKDFAKETPFGLAQATQGFVKMKALGLDPTRAALTSFGNTASAMGKDLNQMIEAVADASTGEFERLKEFGIKAKKEGDQVSLTFQGVTTTIKNSAAEITQYLENIGNVSFGGAMEERAKTLDGTIAALGDTWDELFRTVSTNNVGSLIFDSVTLANGALEDATTLLRAMGGAAQDASRDTGALSTIQNGIATVFETVAVLGANLKYVLVQIGNEIGGLAAQVAQAAQFNFAGVRAIREQMVADAEAARKEIDATTERILRARKAQEEYARYATRNASAATDPRRVDAGGSTTRAAGSASSGAAKAVKETISEYDKLIKKLSDELPAASAAAEAAQMGYNKAQTEFLALAASPAWAKFTNDQRATVAALFENKIASEQSAEAAKTLAKANLDAAASREKYLASLSTGLDKIQADIAAQKEATARMGLSKQAIADLDAAKLEMLATDLELQAIKAMDRNLDQQTYDALKKQAAAYRELGIAKKGGAAKEAALEMEKANAEAAKKAQEDWERAAEQINSSLTDALLRGFESGKDFAKNLRDTVVNMFKTMVLRPVISAVVSPVAGAITGALGLAGAANAGTSALGAIGSAASGASFLGNAAGLLGGAGTAAGYGFSALMSGNGLGALSGGLGMLTSGGGAAVAAQGAGMMAGVLGPIALGIGLLSSLSKKKIRDIGIDGEFGGETGFEGQRYTYSKKWFSTKTEYSALEEEVRASFGNAFIAARDSLRQYGEILSLPIEGIDDFTSHMKLSLKGLNDQEVQEAFATAIRDKSNELAKTLIGSWESVTETVTRQVRNGGNADDGWVFEDVSEQVTNLAYVQSEYARSGEEAIDTLTRLATSLSGVNAIWDQLGNTLMDASLAGADAASRIADAFGGLEAMAATTGTYFQNFYSPQEQRAAVERQLNDALGKLNLTLPDIDATNAREQYRMLAEAQDRSTDEGLKAYVMLLQLSGAFASVTDAAQILEQQRQSAYSVLQRSVSAERGMLRARLGAARDVADTIGGVFDVLRTNVRELYGEVDSTRAMQAQQGNDFIAQALATARSSGYLPDADKLAEAIAAAREGLDASDFGGDSAERDYAALVLAGKLSGLESIAGKQLTDAQRTVKQLELQSGQLDQTLDYWKQQIDIASGTYDGILSVEAAVQQLSGVLNPSAPGGKAGSSTGGGASGWVDSSATPRVSYGADEALTSFEKFKGWYQGLRNNVDPGLLMGSGYEVPDWLRVSGMARDGTNEELFKQYTFFKNNSQYASDFEKIMTQGRSGYGTDGSTLAKSDLSKMPAEAAEFFRANLSKLLSYEGAGLDPVLAYQLYKYGPEKFGLNGKEESFTEWLRNNQWTENGIVAGNNASKFAGMDWAGYNLAKYDLATGNLIFDGVMYTPDGKLVSGEDAPNKPYQDNFGKRDKPKDRTDYNPFALLDDEERKKLAAGFPGFAVGTNYVPRDMLARIHEGEAIIPKAYNPAAGGMQSNARLESLIEKLTAEVAELKAAAKSTADHTGRSADVLVAVRRGDSLSQVAEPTF